MNIVILLIMKDIVTWLNTNLFCQHVLITQNNLHTTCIKLHKKTCGYKMSILVKILLSNTLSSLMCQWIRNSVQIRNIFHYDTKVTSVLKYCYNIRNSHSHSYLSDQPCVKNGTVPTSCHSNVSSMWYQPQRKWLSYIIFQAFLNCKNR